MSYKLISLVFVHYEAEVVLDKGVVQGDMRLKGLTQFLHEDAVGELITNTWRALS